MGRQSVYLEAMLNYNRMFDETHDVNGMLLYNQREFDDGSSLPYRNQGLAGDCHSYLRKYIAEFNLIYGSEILPGKKIFPAFALMGYIGRKFYARTIKCFF